MKLLNLFCGGTSGTGGTALQGQGFAAVPLDKIEVGRVGRGEESGGDIGLFRPTCPTCENESGTAEIVEAVSPSHSSHLSHSKNDTEAVVGDCPKQQRLTCAGHPEHCRPGCVHAVPYYTAPNGEVYFIRRVKAENNTEPHQQHPEPEVGVCTRAQGRLLQ
jgi:hypothetical protein